MSCRISGSVSASELRAIAMQARVGFKTEDTVRGTQLPSRAFLWGVGIGTTLYWFTFFAFIFLEDSSPDEVGTAVSAVFLLPVLIGTNVAIGYAFLIIVSLIAPKEYFHRSIFILSLSISMTFIFMVVNLSLGRPYDYMPYFYVPLPPLTIVILHSIQNLWPLYCLSALAGALTYLCIDRQGQRTFD